MKTQFEIPSQSTQLDWPNRRNSQRDNSIYLPAEPVNKGHKKVEKDGEPTTANYIMGGQLEEAIDVILCYVG